MTSSSATIADIALVARRTMAMVYFASARKADRDCNLEPPASPYAIMRRTYPYRGENSGPGKDIVGKLDTQTRN